MSQMKKIWISLLIIGILISNSVRLCNASFKLEKDKIAHIVVSAIIYDCAYLYCENKGLDKFRSVCYATLVTAAAGIFKEQIDDVFDRDDLLADGIGLGIGIALMEIEF